MNGNRSYHRYDCSYAHCVISRFEISNCDNKLLLLLLGQIPRGELAATSETLLVVSNPAKRRLDRNFEHFALSSLKVAVFARLRIAILSTSSLAFRYSVVAVVATSSALMARYDRFPSVTCLSLDNDRATTVFIGLQKSS